MKQEPTLDELAARLVRAVPGLETMRGELENNFRALLRSHLDRLDLVSRERFDTQAEMLSRTQARLQALEERIKALETEEPQGSTAQ